MPLYYIEFCKAEDTLADDDFSILADKYGEDSICGVIDDKCLGERFMTGRIRTPYSTTLDSLQKEFPNLTMLSLELFNSLSQ